MDNSMVSIIIPCYNGEKYLGEFLKSLIAQEYPYVEVIFADDGSTDGTKDVYQEYERSFPLTWTSRYLQLKHSGQATAICSALPFVSGEYLMWSDADDIMLPGSITKKVEFLRKNSGYRMVRNDFLYYYPEKNLIKSGYGLTKSKGDDIFESIFDGTMPCLAGTYMMESSLMFECYPEKRIPLSDEGQNLQLLLPPCSRSKCGFIDEPLMKYRIHKDSHSNKSRGIAEQFRREEGFYKLRRELLDYCVCNREYFEALANKIYEIQKHKIVRKLIDENQRIMRGGSDKEDKS